MRKVRGHRAGTQVSVRLSPAERAAGRAWRQRMLTQLAGRNVLDPPDLQLPPFIRHYRHLCDGAGGKSVSFDYAEVYTLSPAFMDVGGADLVPRGSPQWKEILQSASFNALCVVEAGRFAFIYHEGRCSGCGLSARSESGWVVDGFTRPPSGRKVVWDNGI